MRIFMKTVVLALLWCGLLFQSISAKIFETSEITEIFTSVDSSEPILLLFDIDDTLLDSELSLNSGKWISYYWKTAPKFESDQSVLECFMWFVNQHIPVKPVDPQTPHMIQVLHDQKNVVALALTARANKTDCGTHENLTARQLNSIGIDFSQSNIPEEFIHHPSFDEGIIFSGGKSKGGHLQQVLEGVGYHPHKIIFVDDKLEQIKSVDKAMEEAGISCDCFWYRRAEKEHTNFNLLIALIQLEYLLNHQKILTDPEAENLKEEYSGIKSEDFVYQLVEQYKAQYCEI